MRFGKFVALGVLPLGLAACEAASGTPPQTAALPPVSGPPATAPPVALGRSPGQATTPAGGASGQSAAGASATGQNVAALPGSQQQIGQQTGPQDGANASLAEMVGKWRVVMGPASRICDLELTAQAHPAGFRANPSAGCPRAIFSVESWSLRGNDVVLRGPGNAIVARAGQSRPRRLEGQIVDSGNSFTMVR